MSQPPTDPGVLADGSASSRGGIGKLPAPQQPPCGTKLGGSGAAARCMGALPLAAFFLLLFPLATAALKAEKKFQAMEMGQLPVITEQVLFIAHFVWDSTLFVLIAMGSSMWAYFKWVSRDWKRIAVLRFLIVVGTAAGLFFYGLALSIPFFYFEHACIAAGTPVDTPSGSRAIESLAVGDEVLTLSPDGKLEAGTITARREHRGAACLRVEFGGGLELHLTKEHPVGTTAGWKPADELKPGDEITMRTGIGIVVRVERMPEQRTVLDLTVAPNPNFFANGILVHNKIWK